MVCAEDVTDSAVFVEHIEQRAVEAFNAADAGEFVWFFADDEDWDDASWEEADATDAD